MMKSLAQYGCLCIALFFCQSATSQDATTSPPPYRATPAHMWEFGIHGGTAMNFGDLDFVPSLGGGIHLRRAIDYVFSVRGDVFYGKLEQKNDFDGTSESTVQSGSLQVLVSINNLIWNNVPRRKTNLYALVGGGITRFEVRATEVLSAYLHNVEPTVQTHMDTGLGISFRMSNRFNLGLEAKALVLFGHDADMLDGVAREETDVMGYGNVRLNFNLGNINTKAEPLYWVNPMDAIMQDITELKNRPTFDLTDSDADGVIDLLDQDNTTPPGVVVDTRGLPLDSDGDGTPNFQDEEPYLPQGSNIVTRQAGEKPVTTEEDVRKVVEEELDKIANNGGRTRKGVDPNDNGNDTPTDNGKANGNNKTNRSNKPDGNNKPDGSNKTDGSTRPNTGTSKGGRVGAGGAITEWFLPVVHFNIDSHKIRYADYGNLSSIARVMKSNPDLQLVVTGFTDKTASDEYNLALSYRRANAVIEHFVEIHGIDRSRFLLHYNGEDYPLVPSTGSTLMNRRVEFRVADGDDVEMRDPDNK